MIQFLDLLIWLYLVAIAPKLLWDRIVRGKKHPALLQRLGRNLPPADRVIWVHAVSVGEVKAAAPLLQELKRRVPNTFLLLTTTTATGYAEAQKLLSNPNAIAYAPVDLSWVVQKWVAHFQPTHFFLIESDFWPQLLFTLKNQGTTTFLVSGKLSPRSASRWARLAPLAKRLFAQFDAIFVQNEEHYKRFLPLVSSPGRLHVTGNLKWDITPRQVVLSSWQKELLPLSILTLSCTHPQEEMMLLNALENTSWFIILAPRHPERFEEVAHHLAERKIPYFRWTQPEQRRGGERVLLVDTMGSLPECYALSQCVLVAGSYIASIGGHNLLEPCLYGAPVIFGPHTWGQTEFAIKIIEAGAGSCVLADQLPLFLHTFPEKKEAMQTAAKHLAQQGSQVAYNTLQKTDLVT